MEEYDTVVVGAGPAGSTAARFSAEGGARTLLLDKRDVVGVPIECGEFLPSNATLAEIMPDVPDIPGLFDVPRECISRPTRRMVVISPRRKSYELDFEGMSLFRAKFDQHLARLAEKGGSELRTSVRVLSATSEGVETEGGFIKAKVVIGADGPHSTVRRTAGMPGPAELYPCLQYTVPGQFGDAVEMHFGRVARGGYAWLIPKGDGANIGLGMPPGRAAGPLKGRLERFLSEMGVDQKPSLVTGGVVPASGPVARTVRGNIMLCGDAAGHVMASNGGGIPMAMVCGRAAGEAAAAFVNGKGQLDDYERRWRSEVGEVLSNSLHVKKLSFWFMWSDVMVGLAMAMIGKRGIRRALTCKRLLWVF
jgi:digeranylgeranylglycerophospholipid reductase